MQGHHGEAEHIRGVRAVYPTSFGTGETCHRTAADECKQIREISSESATFIKMDYTDTCESAEESESLYESTGCINTRYFEEYHYR